MSTIKIDHVAFYVDDLERSREFFEKYFEATSNKKYINESSGFQSYFLSFESGARIELMYKPDFHNTSEAGVNMENNHIAFSVGSRERVDELTKALAKDGYEVKSGPRITGDGYYESCIITIGGSLIEITE